MVKLKKENKGRQAWHDTVNQIARDANAQLVAASPAPKRRETRKRVAKAHKAQSRWIEEQGVDAKELGVWARVDRLLDAPRESRLAAVEDESDGGEYAEDSNSDVDMSDAERARAAAAKPKGARKAPARGAKAKPAAKPKKPKAAKGDAAAAARAARHKARTLPAVLLDAFAPSRGAALPKAVDYVTCGARPPRPARPPHRVCVVTGRFAPYRDPDTGLPFADADAGALLRENPPPWLRLARNGSQYYEALLQIRTERRDEAPGPADAPRAAPPRYNHDGSLLAPGQKPGEPDPPGWYRGRRFE